MSVQKPNPILLALAGAGVLFALLAAKCETQFVDYVAEICNDNQDNDSDGQTDCKDSDCAAECNVEVTILQPPQADADSLPISGTSLRAASVAVTVTPSGNSGQATLQANGVWEFLVRNITQPGATYTVKAIATSAEGLSDTATATFERGQ